VTDKSQLIAKARLESKNISEIEKKNKQQLAQERSDILRCGDIWTETQFLI
jgi:hypothetical protein